MVRRSNVLQKPGRALMEKQLDYDVIPADIFAEAIVENGVLKILDKTCKSDYSICAVFG